MTSRLAIGVLTGVLIATIATGAQQTHPMTAPELTLQRAMRTINSNKPGLRAGLTDPAKADMKKVAAELAALKAAWTDAEGFFKDQKAADAIAWAGDALKLVDRMDKAASSTPPNWDEIRAVGAMFSPLCSQCHKARRETLPDGTYRFKAGS